MHQIERRRFDHIGLISNQPHEGEQFVEATRAWITSPRAHPLHVEWIRFEPDSPVSGSIRTEPHVAFRVDDIQAAMIGQNVILEPLVVGDGFCTISFVDIDGAIIEYMQYRNPDEEGWM
jgi:hypothetical protein